MSDIQPTKPPLQLETGWLSWGDRGSMHLDYVTLFPDSGQKGTPPTFKGDGVVSPPEIPPTELPVLKGIATLVADYSGEMRLGYNLTGMAHEAIGPLPAKPDCVGKRVRRASEVFEYMDDLNRYVAILNDVQPHPNIVQTTRIIYDEEQDAVLSLMEGVDQCLVGPCTVGGMEFVPCLRASVVLTIVRDVLKALVHLEEKGIVHGDVRPQNILYEKTDRPEEEWTYKLSGFECSVTLAGKEVAESRTTSMCTYAYASAETVRGDGISSSAADIWSLGVTIHVLLYGRLPLRVWHAEPDIMGSILEGKFELSAPRKTEDPVEAVLHGMMVEMMSLDPLQRLSASAYLKKLEGEPVLTHDGPSAPAGHSPRVPSV